MITPEEAERIAYTTGDVKTASLLAAAIDVEDLAHELDKAKEEIERLRDDLFDANARIVELETELESRK